MTATDIRKLKKEKPTETYEIYILLCFDDIEPNDNMS